MALVGDFVGDFVIEERLVLAVDGHLDVVPDLGMMTVFRQAWNGNLGQSGRLESRRFCSSTRRYGSGPFSGSSDGR
jgi:hypothetical protein